MSALINNGTELRLCGIKEKIRSMMCINYIFN